MMCSIPPLNHLRINVLLRCFFFFFLLFLKTLVGTRSSTLPSKKKVGELRRMLDTGGDLCIAAVLTGVRSARGGGGGDKSALRSLSRLAPGRG